MTLRVGDILELLKELAPFPLAEEWDNVGLQLGDPHKDVRRILVALDPTLENIKQAADQNIDLLITHHPLIFKPLKRINSETPEGRRLTSALLAGLAIISLHTNLDQIPQGVSYALARAMGLENLQVLVPGEKAEACKLVVFIPKGYEEKVKKALFVGLPNEINDPLACSFGVLGEATFTPPEGGGHEALSRAAQWRLEAVVPKAFVPLILETLKRVHPYERPIYDIYP
ncbi:MAG TPA: Nif3-like dinuclear metal center hexameric protein, partial [Thermodesulfatator sp.]|nr:Nif3-like dinuclear metal center hexameric protein [Thermodesulfatator sp.]